MAEDMRDFAEAFGLEMPSSEEPDDEPTEATDADVEESEETEETDGQETEEAEEETDSEETDDSESEESEKGKADAQRNYAFAQLRNENKKLNSVLRDVGKILGLDGQANDEAILEGVQHAVMEQQAKAQGIPVETLEKITRLETLAEENERIRLEKETTQSFSELIEEFGLDNDQVNEFTEYLIKNDKNPLNGAQINLKAEYLTLHWDEMLQKARDEAIAADTQRREKAKNHAAGGTPTKKGDVSKEGDYEISSMNDLNAFLDKQSL